MKNVDTLSYFMDQFALNTSYTIAFCNLKKLLDLALTITYLVSDNQRHGIIMEVTLLILPFYYVAL